MLILFILLCYQRHEETQNYSIPLQNASMESESNNQSADIVSRVLLPMRFLWSTRLWRTRHKLPAYSRVKLAAWVLFAREIWSTIERKSKIRTRVFALCKRKKCKELCVAPCTRPCASGRCMSDEYCHLRVYLSCLHPILGLFTEL